VKKTLLTVGTILTGMSLFAQSHHFTPFKKNTLSKHQQLIQSLLNNQAALQGTAQKPTDIHQRVIAQTFRNEDMEIEDTMTFKYSGARGSKYNHNNQEFNYNSYFRGDYFPHSRTPLDGSAMDLLADSIIYHYEDPTEVDISNAYYRANNKIDSFRNIYTYTDAGTTYFDFQKTYHQFNNLGYLSQITISDSTETSTSFEISSISKFFYNNAQNQLLSDTTYLMDNGNLMPFVAQSYHYNTQNQLDSISLCFNNGASFSLYGETYIIYTNGNLIEKINTVYYDNMGAITNTDIDSFGYTGALPFYTLRQTTEVDNVNSEQYASRIVKHLGSNNLPDSTSFLFDDGTGNWELDMTIKYQYNSFNNPTALMAKYEDGSFGGGFNFYYETYDDGNNVGIKEVASNKNYTVYPNPFDNKINIDWRNATTNVKISLINILGQTIYSVDKHLISGNNPIELPVLIKGNYLLTIQDEKGQTFTSRLLKK
jgi:hypothetical protein